MRVMFANPNIPITLPLGSYISSGGGPAFVIDTTHYNRNRQRPIHEEMRIATDAHGVLLNADITRLYNTGMGVRDILDCDVRRAMGLKHPIHVDVTSATPEQRAEVESWLTDPNNNWRPVGSTMFTTSECNVEFTLETMCRLADIGYHPELSFGKEERPIAAQLKAEGWTPFPKGRDGCDLWIHGGDMFPMPLAMKWINHRPVFKLRDETHRANMEMIVRLIVGELGQIE